MIDKPSYQYVDEHDIAIDAKVGDLSNLQTMDKDSVVDAVNELFQSVSNGKSTVASAITDKGVSTASDATFAVMATNIRSISTGVTPTGTKNIDSNGDYDVSSYASAHVSVPSDAPTDEAITITQNGVTNVPTGKRYNPITVSVPNPSTGSLNITQNGTYDVTQKASAVVNVPQGITPSGTKSISENGTYDVTNFAIAAVNVPQNHLHFDLNFSADLGTTYKTLATNAKLAEIKSLDSAIAVFRRVDSQIASAIIFSYASNVKLSDSYYGLYLRTNTSSVSSPVGNQIPLKDNSADGVSANSIVGHLYIDDSGNVQIYSNSSYKVRAGNYTLDVFW